MKWFEYLKWILNDKGSFAVTYDFSPNTVIASSNVNTNFADIETAINDIDTYIGTGVITNAMLATINTAGKVSGAALTSLANTPSAAGILPVANGGTEFDSGDICLSTTAKDESGWTEITSTYAGKYIRIGSTGLATGGAATHTHAAGSYTNGAHTHTLATGTQSGSQAQNYLMSSGGYIMSQGTGSGTSACVKVTTTSGGTATITGTSAAGANTPLYVDLRLFQKS